MDMNNNIDADTSTHTDDNTNDAEDYTSQDIVSHVQHDDSEKNHYDHDDNVLRKTVYGPTYVPYKEDCQKILLPQSTDIS